MRPNVVRGEQHARQLMGVVGQLFLESAKMQYGIVRDLVVNSMPVGWRSMACHLWKTSAMRR